jgi:hypothetical protein
MVSKVTEANRLMTDAYQLSAQLKETALHVADPTATEGKEDQAFHVINLAAAIGDHIQTVQGLLTQAQALRDANRTEDNDNAVAQIEDGLEAIRVLKIEADVEADRAAEVAENAVSGDTAKAERIAAIKTRTITPETKAAASANRRLNRGEAAIANVSAQTERERRAAARAVVNAERVARETEARAAAAREAAAAAAAGGAPPMNRAAALAAASGAQAEASALLAEIDRLKASRAVRPTTFPQGESTFSELNLAYEVLRRIHDEYQDRISAAAPVAVGSIPPVDPELIAGIERARMVLEAYKKEEADNAELLRISLNLETAGYYYNQELRTQDVAILNEMLARSPDSAPWINPLLVRLNPPPPVVGEVGQVPFNPGPSNIGPEVAGIVAEALRSPAEIDEVVIKGQVFTRGSCFIAETTTSRNENFLQYMRVLNIYTAGINVEKMYRFVDGAPKSIINLTTIYSINAMEKFIQITFIDCISDRDNVIISRIHTNLLPDAEPGNLNEERDIADLEEIKERRPELSPLTDPLLVILRYSQGLKQPPVPSSPIVQPLISAVDPELGVGSAPPPAAPPPPTAGKNNDECDQKIRFQPPNVVESMVDHIQKFVQIRGGTLEKIEVNNKVRQPLQTLLKSLNETDYVDIVNPQQRSGSKDYDVFGPTCVGSHALSVRFNDKKKFTTGALAEVTGGGKGTAFVFLIAVPGKDLKPYKPK